MSDHSSGEVLAAPSPSERRTRGSFDEFYVGELPRLVALARALSSAAIAEDIAQEAMLIAYRRWREVREMAHPEQWVRRTCANLAVSHFRRSVVELRAKARLAARRPPPDELDRPAEEFWAAVRALPNRQAQAAALRFVYDLPIVEIAQTMDCTEGTVKQHLSRARRSLAATLGVTEEES